jgi:hypothetical protein
MPQPLAAGAPCGSVPAAPLIPSFLAAGAPLVVRVAGAQAAAPSASVECAVGAAYRSHRIVAVSDLTSPPTRVFGVSLPTVPPATGLSDLAPRRVALYENRDGTLAGIVIHAADDAGAERVLADWAVALESSASGILPNGPATGDTEPGDAWQRLARWTMSWPGGICINSAGLFPYACPVNAFNGSLVPYYITSNMTMTASFYRLDTTEVDYDYYMAWERFQTGPGPDCQSYHYTYCHLMSRQETIALNPSLGALLPEHGPAGTQGTSSTTTTQNWNVGASVSNKVSAGYSSTFSMTDTLPSVVVTDNTAGATGAWTEQIGSGGTAYTATYFNDFSTIFQVPKAAVDYKRTPNPLVGFNLLNNIDVTAGGGNFGTNTYQNPTNFLIDIAPTYFAVDVSEVDVQAGQSKTFNIIAAPPVTSPTPQFGVLSQTALSWVITNSDSSLALTPTSGSGSTNSGPDSPPSITVTAEPHAAVGHVAYLQVNTNPPNAAYSVQAAPFSVKVCIVGPSGACPTSGLP